MDAGVKRSLAFAAVLALVVAAALLIIDRWRRFAAPGPETIAAASLQGLREQNRLSAFAARFVAVVTTRQTRFGVLSAEKTLIMPGMVRYEIDLSRLRPADVRWNGTKRTLAVTLPPVEVSAPEIDMTQIREYGSGGMLLALTDAGADLDLANRRAGQAELSRQARDSVTMNLAREATRRAVARSFAMPLRAAGIDATVDARFPGEPPGARVEPWDESRPLSEVLGSR